MSKNRERAVLEFTEMMEILLNSGLSIKDALEVLTVTGQEASRGNRGASLGKQLLEYIHKGASFAQAVNQLEEYFPPIYRGMIRVGNAAGSVERIFPRLRVYLSDQKKLREKVSAALVYPVLVLAVAFLGTLGLIFFVMPKMEQIFAGFGGDAGNTVRGNIRIIETGLIIPSFLLTLILCILIVIRKNKGGSSEINKLIDLHLLSMPLIGPYISSWETFNFSFAMEVLTGGGIAVENALGEAANLVSNSAYRLSLLKVRERVLNGGSLAAAFLKETALPSNLGHWVAVGEKAGKTDLVFSRIRSWFQEELEQRTSKFLLLLEPVLIIIIGLVILGLVVGIILPLFSIYGTIL
ncbi:bacterial type II secretion system protein F domain protein [Treponema primitia ZAS-2]|uniref:General secretion pathway protein F n=1 Tax=Treponema primitia (strain ATCC BAA-887 / DSM 12427 / ZAS-2) TaxID=545694 RepID=F5YQP6_TREPZ|nr:type II secretion system F family protein [Treponema primitia]AEF84681.1 bacterial type II secretion system protein F domain protein [Treponema primitia ZAS-2]